MTKPKLNLYVNYMVPGELWYFNGLLNVPPKNMFVNNPRTDIKKTGVYFGIQQCGVKEPTWLLIDERPGVGTLVIDTRLAKEGNGEPDILHIDTLGGDYHTAIAKLENNIWPTHKYPNYGLLVYADEVLINSSNQAWVLKQKDFWRLLEIPLNVIKKQK